MSKYLSICSISFLILILFSTNFFKFSLLMLIKGFCMFIEWEVVSFNSCSIVMTFLFDWMSLLFMSFALLISSLVIYYSKEYMGGDLNMNRFIMHISSYICFINNIINY